MVKEKFLHLLWYIFVYSPLTFCVGLSLIILAGERIVGGTFQVIKFRKKRAKVNKTKFAEMMKRLTD